VPVPDKIQDLHFGLFGRIFKYMVTAETLKEVVDRLVSRFHPEKIILFGSQARGTADDRSDIDFLVITNFQGSRRKLWLEMERSLNGMRLPRDIILLTPDEYEIDKDIVGTIAWPAYREGRILYAKSA
jgi:predicted nucleotidyltransferase